MTTYNTGNPVPSADARDRFDNSQTFDELLNGTQASYQNRIGQALKSWKGFELDFAQFLLNSGYQFIGDYDADGPLTLTVPNQIFSKDGEYWRPGPALVLPYTTVNNWAVDQPKFVSVGDAALRSDLAAPGGLFLVEGGDFSDATVTADLFPSAAPRSLKSKAADSFRLDLASGLTPNNPAVDNGPVLNVIFGVAAANRIRLDGFGATFYVRTPVQPQSYLHLSRCRFKSMGSPDGAGVAKSHISVIAIDGVTALKTGMYFEDVEVDGSRNLWPNISMSTAGPEGGGSEDGGMHAWRIAGRVTNSTWVRCKGVNAGTAGWAIHSPTPSTSGATYDHQNLKFIDCEGTGNREHGMFGDSSKFVQWIGGKLTGNGLDLNTTDPLVHGNRGARDTNGDLFGMPFDWEAYGPNFFGSQFTDILMRDVDCRGNAIMGTIYTPIASNLAGFASAVNLELLNLVLDTGVAALADRPAGTDGLALNVLGNQVTTPPFNGVKVSCQMSGRPQFNGVAKLEMATGFVEAVSPKAIVNNSSFFDVSCPGLSSALTVFPQPQVTFTKTGGAASAAFVPTLQATRGRPGCGVTLSYSVSITGATAAGGRLTATLSPPNGYIFDNLSFDVVRSDTLVDVRHSLLINGVGGSAALSIDTSNDVNLTAVLRADEIQSV